MLKKITRIFSGFVLSLAFIFPPVSLAVDYMQLYVSPPIKGNLETTISKLDSPPIATNYMQLYINPPINNNVANDFPLKPLPFGTTIDSGTYYDFYFHYQNPKPYPEKPRMLRDFLR